MKLILKEYLASLRERGELDAVLPDLLSQLGMNVFSRPARGTRQDGVDVAAVGKMSGKTQKVYLFAIKPGNLTRQDWAGNKPQDLRPSLTEILDAYIPHRLPTEHRNKKIVICICIGGDILETVRPSLEGYIKQHESSDVTFEQWNGDKLANLIQASFLREELLPGSSRSLLRKSLAMLDEPETAYTHFAHLVQSLSAVDQLKHKERLTALRQIGICLWILFAWSREAENMEAAYRSSELALLHGWKIVRLYGGKNTKAAKAILESFNSISTAHELIYTEYLVKCVAPHVDKRHGLSTAVRGSSSLDINLAMFDVLGRLAMQGIWAYWGAQEHVDEHSDIQSRLLATTLECAESIKALVSNNPALLLPIKDDQAIDIWLAVFILALHEHNLGDIDEWLTQIADRARFAFRTHGPYPCNHMTYNELLEHPRKGDDDYRKNATQGSILYPVISLWAALLDLDDLYGKIAKYKGEELEHCNFQYWYPDDTSEAHIYANDDLHGATLSGLHVELPQNQLLGQIFGECEQSPHFTELSAVRYGYWPLVLVACRHYRLPPPLHLLESLRPEEVASDMPTESAKNDSASNRK